MRNLTIALMTTCGLWLAGAGATIAQEGGGMPPLQDGYFEGWDTAPGDERQSDFAADGMARGWSDTARDGYVEEDRAEDPGFGFGRAPVGAPPPFLAPDRCDGEECET